MAKQLERGELLTEIKSTVPPLGAPAVTTDDGLDSALRTLTECFAEDLGANTALLALLNEQRGVAETRFAWGTDADVDGLTHSVGEGFVGRLLESKQRLYEPLDVVRATGLEALDGAVPMTHAVGASICLGDRPDGAICAGFATTPGTDVESLCSLAEGYASALALCLRGSPRAFASLVRAGREDGLTGVLNYAGLQEALADEISRSERHGHQLCCCFLDLERFKRVNDEHGHDHGNHVLAAVSGALRSSVRSSDIVARFGGDEFVVVLPETDEDAARALCERLREEIARVTIELHGEPVSARIGIAAWEKGSAPAALLRDADRAMRLATEQNGSPLEPSQG